MTKGSIESKDDKDIGHAIDCFFLIALKRSLPIILVLLFRFAGFLLTLLTFSPQKRDKQVKPEEH